MKKPMICCWLVLFLIGGLWASEAAAEGWSFPRPKSPFRSFDWKKFRFRSQNPEDEEDDNEFETKAHTPLIGEYAVIAGRNLIALHGVGVVTGLDGTGSDPPPSPYRTELYDDMRRRGINKPNQFLSKRSNALVVVTAYLPPLVKKGDRFDVEIRLPGNSDATNLNGGWLMECSLMEKAFVPGRGPLKGDVYARAKGPVLISAEDGDAGALAGVLRRGRVLGGGVALQSRHMSLLLRNDFKSVRNSNRIALRIGRRFFQYNEHGSKKELATAETDQKIKLDILDRYRDNFPRYSRVVRSIAFRETEVAERVRLQKLKKELLVPETSERAAIRLEAIGLNAIPFLREGLKSPLLEIRFHAATALAYLGKSDGLNALADAASEEPAFRIFAFAAMSIIDDAEANLKLHALLSHESAETRYGAFRTLTTMDQQDPLINGEKLGNEFMLHVLNVDGPPLIHLTSHKKAEVVLFGEEISFTTPIAVQAGNHIRIMGQPGKDTLLISRYQVGKPDRRAEVSRHVGDIIRQVSEFGASYPDVAQMLFQASRQGNLQARLELDTLPESGRVYYRSRSGDKKEQPARIGNSKTAPNLFGNEKKSNSNNRDLPADERNNRGKASVADITDGGSEKNDARSKKEGFFSKIRLPFQQASFAEPRDLNDE